MSEQKVTVSVPGIGFASLLAIVFITLKLTSVIAWSWWWVLSPLWIPAAFVVLIFALVVGMAMTAAWIGKVK